MKGGLELSVQDLVSGWQQQSSSDKPQHTYHKNRD